MVARCKCGRVYNISIKANIPPTGYECPKCEEQRKKALIKPNRKKSEGRVSSVLLRNRTKHSISNS
jgi:hypothetical protein